MSAMRSSSFYLKSDHVLPLELQHRSSRSSCLPRLLRLVVSETECHRLLRVPGTIQRHQSRLEHTKAFDDDSFDIPSLNSCWSDNEGSSYYMMSSSDGEDSDGEIIINPVSDMDLPSVKVSTNDALTLTIHRFAMIGMQRKKSKIRYGAFVNMGLIGFITAFLLLIDGCVWRIVRLPLEPFYLTRPFFMSTVIASCAGYIFLPLLDSLHAYQNIRKEGPFRHSLKESTPTMGGLFFVPVGVAVALYIAGFSSVEVTGAAAVTLAYAAIGLLHDTLAFLDNQNYGLFTALRILLEMTVGIFFSSWLDCTRISSPYGMKKLVPLPAPIGIVSLGRCYMPLTSFCFVSMGNGVKLTDGLDGLAGGTAAFAFVAMSIAVLPISPGLAIFGASMAGACVGFLLHNRYEASISMGDTGSIAIGGALAAMASCTGMFFPLFISSGIFVLEAFSVILQESCFKATESLWGYGHRLLQMAPFHHYMELCGFKEPVIVAGSYAVSAFLSLFAAYVGLTSV
ncbi:hypothetical protein SAY86_006553 [Trapa natans]|uniref:Phospho-N-acetylmuramoyl-pentapeptide-transferase n=1 Tax=Trapa natans TaxID=22666 RepID=A0AAN7L620_TRANT|nr:hypothetical protein SAY86_006553 [Trapa natans]